MNTRACARAGTQINACVCARAPPPQLAFFLPIIGFVWLLFGAVFRSEDFARGPFVQGFRARSRVMKDTELEKLN